MGKIKLNLVSGAIVEKPLINAFKTNNISYVVLDNEMNGSMGLPIILVCKLENDRVTKIVDQNEWQIVKEYLKNIIAGNQIEFISVASEMPADDIYYTQLTLPVPSFDALKNAYKDPGTSSEGSTDPGTASILDINSNTPNNPVNDTVMPQVETPSVEISTPNPVTAPADTPVTEASNSSSPVIDLQPSMPSVETPTVEPSAPVGPVGPVEPVVPQIETPTVDMGVPNPVDQGQTDNSNVINNIGATPISPVGPMPDITNNNVSEIKVEETPSAATPTSDDNNLFKEQKEAFMQACENMFDALVQKFEKELENRK